jgi:dihydroorotate dehydrogenase
MTRAFLWRFIRTVLFFFDPESAHRTLMKSLGVVHALFPGFIRWISGTPKSFTPMNKEIFGINFWHPLGLAAGFDKDAEYLPLLQDLGFSFVEIGTVTPLTQPGNDRPRLFRDSKSQSLFNRMGFNSAGATQVARNLRVARKNLRAGFRVGVNIGKNKNTEIQYAHLDYERAIEPFEGLIDYVVINVSSPNTPGLRDLQTPLALQKIFKAVQGKVACWPHPVPILVKLAPEVEMTDFDVLSGVLEPLGLSGWVLTNTLMGTFSSVNSLAGGWSGGKLTALSRDFLSQARLRTALPIISVGGIMSTKEACFRLKSGAQLIQIYSGWVFNGPRFPANIVSAVSTQDINK